MPGGLEQRVETDYDAVIPTHARQIDHLLAALDSVGRQSVPPRRVIVVVDGNQQAAAELRRRSLGIDVLTHSRPMGEAAARQTGIDSATSAWVAFLDDDDLWAPRKQEVLFNYIAEHPECKAIRAGYWTFCSEDEPTSAGLFGQRIELRGDHLEDLERAVSLTSPRNDLEYLDILGRSLPMMLEFNRGVIGTTMVKRQILQQIPHVPSGLRPAADYLLFCHVAAETEWHLVRARLEFYRLHGGQDSRVFGSAGARNILLAKKIAWENHRARNPRPMETYGSIYADEIRTFVWAALRARQFSGALAIYREGLPLLPRAKDKVVALSPAPLVWRWRRLTRLSGHATSSEKPTW